MRTSYPPNAGYHILSPGTEIVWGPFRARVGDLHQTRCQINAHVDPMIRCMTLAFRWEDSSEFAPVYGISDRIPCELFEDRKKIGGYLNYVSVHMRISHNISMAMSELTANTMDWRSCQIGEAAASPHGTFVNYNINDFIMWNGQDTEQTESVIVQPDNVPELLARIKELQEPRAKELIKKDRKEQGKLLTQAKILTFERSA